MAQARSTTPGGGSEIQRSWSRPVAPHAVVSGLFTTLDDLRAALIDRYVKGLKGPHGFIHSGC
ncbi:hypothetical protein GCM10010433_68910 [Streptomyces pulveraceus]|uniref:Uncharacterized protein n=2 Tax=Streptomyces pulveraceus TaxID=68258 RepID=A0ABW1GIU6_9ACTN